MEGGGHAHFYSLQVYFKTLSQLWWLGGEIPSRRRAKSLVQGLRAISKCLFFHLLIGKWDDRMWCCFAATVKQADQGYAAKNEQKKPGYYRDINLGQQKAKNRHLSGPLNAISTMLRYVQRGW